MVHVAFTGQIRRSQHELREDAADGPDVDGSTVVPTAEEQFWRSVPSARRVFRYARTVSSVFRGTESGEAGSGSRLGKRVGAGRKDAPRDHLTGHLVSRVRSVTGKTKIRYLQLPV